MTPLMPVSMAGLSCLVGELQMFDDVPVRLSYNAGLERSFLAVLAVFGNQFG